MKHFLSVAVFLLVLSASSVCAQNLPQAEEFYRQGRFADALTQYEQALKDYPNDPFVYYNIGNCYFKMGSSGLAAANYYRAFKLNPRDADIRHNLELALAAGGEQLVDDDVPPALHKLFFYLSYPELQGLVFGLFWVWGLLACVWMFKRKGGAVLVVLSVALGVSGLWLYARYSLENRTLAVVAAPVAEVRSGPGSNFPANANVSQGHLLTVKDKKDNWYQVVVNSQGIQGWLEAASLEKI